jgi:hypothetical protein
VLAAIRGMVPSRIPYAPRFDLWFNAHRHRGTLPEEYRGCMTPLDVSRKLGVGAHMIVPEYLEPRDPSDMEDRGLGVYRLRHLPYRAEFRGVERTVAVSEGRTEVSYRTPKGKITAAFEFTPEMRDAGTSISWIRKHAFTSEEDYEPLIYLFDRLEPEPRHEGLTELIREAGEDALVVANGSMAGSPMQFIMRDLMDMNTFFFQTADNPEKLRALADSIGGYFERLMPAAASCSAEAILFGANMDETITYPPFYEEHILPWIQRFAGMAHKRGKYVLIHADGENRALFDLYRQSDIDILEAVATAPMTKSDIVEVLEKTEGMTVWGGIPSVALMPTFSEPEFERFMERMLSVVGKRSRFILGISDTTPPDAEFGRISRIKEMVENRN